VDAGGLPLGPGQNLTHQELGFRAGNQRSGIGRELQLPEGGLTKNVLEGLPCRPAAKEGFECLQLPGLKGTVILEVELQPLHPQNVGQEMFRIQPTIVHALSPKVLAAPTSERDGGPGHSRIGDVGALSRGG
jgi:hypothetical protein